MRIKSKKSRDKEKGVGRRSKFRLLIIEIGKPDWLH